MKQIRADKNQVAYCGLYCGACKKYLNEKCPGCHKNEKASWCKVRTCCMDRHYLSCAECSQYPNASDCEKFNNLFSKLFGFFLGSDRQACINLIKDMGYADYAGYMAKNRMQTIKRDKD